MSPVSDSCRVPGHSGYYDNLSMPGNKGLPVHFKLSFIHILNSSKN